jgi:hypothetical protein
VASPRFIVTRESRSIRNPAEPKNEELEDVIGNPKNWHSVVREFSRGHEENSIIS